MKGMKIREPRKDASKRVSEQERCVTLRGESTIQRATLHSVSKDVGTIVVCPRTGKSFRVMA